MLQVTGDIWSLDFEARCVTTNGVVLPSGDLVMGKGIAQQAKKRYPGIEAILGSWVKAHGNWPHYIKEFGVISYPTKWHWRDPSDPILVTRGAERLVEIADSNGLKSIGLPRPGCGLGRLCWFSVCEHIKDILDDRFTVVSQEAE